MAFDISTAKPINDNSANAGGFDLKTAKPIDDKQNNGIWSNIKNFINTAPQRTEEQISQRPSYIGEAIKSGLGLGYIKEHPFKSIGAAFEGAEALPADVALKLDKPQEIISDIQKTLSGQRPAQIGDVLRKAAMPEPIPSIGGLAAFGAKGMPTRVLSEGLGLVTKPVTSLAKMGTEAVAPTASKVGAKFIRLVTGKVPEQSAYRALTRDVFNEKELEKAGNEVADLYKTHINPLRANPNATVTLNNAKQKLLDEGLIDAKGNYSAELSKMKPSEQSKIKSWINEINNIQETRVGQEKFLVPSSTPQSFKDVESLLNRIDRDRQAFYDRLAQSGLTEKQAKLRPFDRVAGIIRDAVDNSMKEEYPIYGEVKEAAKKHILDKQAASAFSSPDPSLFKASLMRQVVGNIPGLVALTSPQVLKEGIKAGRGLAGYANRNPDALTTALVTAIRNGNQSSQ